MQSSCLKGSAAAANPLRALPFLVLLLPAPAPASPSEFEEHGYVETLVEAARRDALHEDPYWHTLLHYKKGLFGLRSLVDDPRFFLAENGKHDPAAELEATIRAFFRPVQEGEKHPVCRFVARYDWLTEKLMIDEARLPVAGCEAFDALVEQIRPESVTLIFPTSFMNSPASMYGHTLLTIRTADGTDLLSYAVNYSAVSDETFGPLYILKGLFGLYKGYFSILPYYAKLQEYSDVNDRDIWEYSLDLNKEEVLRLMMHVYEMQEIYADYFFFNENCSYDLLFLLDAARPYLNLTDQCGSWVIPLDTIREVKKSGMVRDVAFRPSRSTKIKHLASLLPGSGRRDALAIAGGDLAPARILERDVSIEEKITVCDLASEYLQYRYAKHELAQAPYLERFLRTLKTRSALGDAAEERHPIPAPERPDEGHHSNRISLGYGVVEDRPFQEIRLRPAYHDLLDSDRGYKQGAQIVFVDLSLRYHSLDEELQLESLDLIDIASIAPRDRFFKHTSWKIKTGLFRRIMADGGDHLVYGVNPGFGYAYERGIIGLWYLMFETDLNVGGALEKNYAAGAGGSSGIIKDLTGFWKLHLAARNIFYGLGDEESRFTASLGQNLRLGADLSLSVEISTSREQGEYTPESVVRCNAFF